MNRKTLRRILITALLVVLVIVVPFGIQQTIQYRQLPGSITVAIGKAGGRYRDVMQAFGKEIERRHGITVEYIETEGTKRNLQLVNKGEVDFALFQPNILSGRKSQEEGEYAQVRVVANVFPEVVLIHASKQSGLTSLVDDEDNSAAASVRVAMGQPGSGDIVSSRAVLDHAGWPESKLNELNLSYDEILRGIVDGEVDLAIVTTGQNASIHQSIARGEKTRLLEVPFVDAFTGRNSYYHQVTIPQGYFQVSPELYPQRDVQTVAVNAQLVSHTRASPSLVTVIAETLLDPEFLTRIDLVRLKRDGLAYARESPALPLHEGARHFYDPELKPFLNPSFVSSTEGIRSFVVSILLAVFIIMRWMKRRRLLRTEHRLDRFIHRLLEIEREQVELDERGVRGGEEAKLGELLNEVTALRREAMASFSANQLMEDRGVECFVVMSNALSDKINAKLTRQRLGMQLQRLRKAVLFGEDDEANHKQSGPPG